MNKNIRVGGAVLVGFVLVGAAVFSRYQTVPIEDAGAAVVVAPPHEYLKTQDTDGDGISDWEENLEGTDPRVPNARKPMPLDTAAGSTTEDTTVTGRYAKNFFREYIQGNSSDANKMGPDEKQKFLEKSLATAGTVAKDDLYTRSEVLINPKNDSDSLHQYGNMLSLALNSHGVKNENEMLIFKRAILSHNEEVAKELDPIIDAYTKIIGDLRAIPVPSSLVNEHLAILNSALVLHNTIATLRNAFNDPLPAIIRFRNYPETATQFAASLIAVQAHLSSSGITWTKDQPGAFFNTATSQ